MTNLHQLQLCGNELEAEVGKDVMSQRAIEHALQRRVEILKASCKKNIHGLCKLCKQIQVLILCGWSRKSVPAMR
jgi:hypothetical protein